jgi:hypothetical protein
MEQAANSTAAQGELYLKFWCKRPENSAELGGDKLSPNLIVLELLIEPSITLV